MIYTFNCIYFVASSLNLNIRSRIPNYPRFPNRPTFPNPPSFPNHPRFSNFPNFQRRIRRIVPNLRNIKISLNLYPVEMGLWKKCTITKDKVDSCDSDDEMYKSGRIVAVRTLLILAMVVCMLAFILELASFRCDKIRSKQVGGILVCASIFGIIAMALYTDYHGNFKETAATEILEAISLDDILKLTYGWTYGFGWFATVMAFISTIFSLAIDSTCPSLCGTKV